jgi:hypothetical protein
VVTGDSEQLSYWSDGGLTELCERQYNRYRVATNKLGPEKAEYPFSEKDQKDNGGK